MPIQIFHRSQWKAKGAGYLLITRSFPHSPQFYPQELSTGDVDCGYSFFARIGCNGACWENPTFCGVVEFYQGESFVQKIGS